jgi:hypothetical protein
VSYAEILPVLLEAFNQFLKDYKNEKSDVDSQLTNLKKQLDLLTAEKTGTPSSKYFLPFL